jgi:hypothetical protein
MYTLLIYTLNDNIVEEQLFFSKEYFSDYDDMLNHIYYLEKYAKRKKLKYLFRMIVDNGTNKLTLHFD